MNTKWMQSNSSNNNNNNNNLLPPYFFLRATLIEDRVESKWLCLACTILNLHEKQRNLTCIILTFISMTVLHQTRFNILKRNGFLNDTKLTKQVLVLVAVFYKLPSLILALASTSTKKVSHNYKSRNFENITFFI